MKAGLEITSARVACQANKQECKYEVSAVVVCHQDGLLEDVSPVKDCICFITSITTAHLPHIQIRGIEHEPRHGPLGLT